MTEPIENERSIEDAQVELDVLQQTLARERLEQLSRLAQDHEYHKKQLERLDELRVIVKDLITRAEGLARDCEKKQAAILVLTKENADLRERLAIIDRIEAMKRTEAST